MPSPESSISGGYLRGVLADSVGRARYGGGRSNSGAGVAGGRVSPAPQPPPLEFVYPYQPSAGAAQDAFVPSPLETANALPGDEGWEAGESVEEAPAAFPPASAPAADAKPPATGAVALSRQAGPGHALPGTAAPTSAQPPASALAPQAYSSLTGQPALEAARETSSLEPVATPQTPVSITAFPPRVTERQAPPPLQEAPVADQPIASKQAARIEVAAVRLATAKLDTPTADPHVVEVADVSPPVSPVVLPQQTGGAGTAADPAGAALAAAQPRPSGANLVPQPSERPGVTIAARPLGVENRSPAEPVAGANPAIVRMEVGIPGVSERGAAQPAHPSPPVPVPRGVKEAAPPLSGPLPLPSSRERETENASGMTPSATRRNPPSAPPSPPPERQTGRTLAVRAAGQRQDAPIAWMPTAAPRSDPDPGAVSPAGRAIFERIAQLQRATQDLATKLAAQQGRSRETTNWQQPAPPPPPPGQPVVIIQRVVGSPTGPRAFWERSYLGRTSWRMLR